MNERITQEEGHHLEAESELKDSKVCPTKVFQNISDFLQITFCCKCEPVSPEQSEQVDDRNPNEKPVEEAVSGATTSGNDGNIEEGTPPNEVNERQDEKTGVVISKNPQEFLYQNGNLDNGPKSSEEANKVVDEAYKEPEGEPGLEENAISENCSNVQEENEVDGGNRITLPVAEEEAKATVANGNLQESSDQNTNLDNGSESTEDNTKVIDEAYKEPETELVTLKEENAVLNNCRIVQEVKEEEAAKTTIANGDVASENNCSEAEEEEGSESDQTRNQIENDVEESANFAVYTRRSGVKNLGQEYEYMMCALYGLKFAIDDAISDFEMTTNENKYGDFDDISLKITFKDGTTKKFLLQLKHADNLHSITETDLMKSRDDFSLIKYLKSSENMATDDSILVLYTNNPTRITDNHEFSFQPKVRGEVPKEFQDFWLRVVANKYQDTGLDLLGSKGTTFQFHISQNQSKFQNIDRFSKQFHFMAKQSGINSVRSDVRQLLEQRLREDLYDSFVIFIKGWHLGNYVLNKHDVIAKLTELTLSPWLKTLSDGKISSKTAPLSRTIMNFDVTVVRDCDDIVEDIWFVPPKTPNLSKAGQKYAVWGQPNKMAWYLGLVPLVVKVNQENAKQVICALQLLGKNINKKKIVLVGDISTEELANLRILTNLADLVDHEVYDTIVSNFRVSLQGKGSISLHQLLCSDDLKKSIGVGDLLTMAHQEAMLIGDKEEKNSTEFYIPRSVALFLLDTNQVVEFCSRAKNSILIINCDERFKSGFRPSGVTVADFPDQEVPKTSGNLILLSVNATCTLAQFQKLSASFLNFNIYSIKIFDSSYSTLQFFKGERLPLTNDGASSRKKITFKQKSVPEEAIFDYFESTLNVFCAPPGMGKSTLLQILSSTYCPPDFCSIHVNLINHNFFLKLKPSHDEILHQFLKVDESLMSKVKTSFSQNGRMYLFLDGLDEVESELVDVVLTFAKAVSSNNIHVWISSRENLEEKISEKLNVVPIEIEELSDQQRTSYIRARLAEGYEKEQIDKIVEMVFSSADVTGSQQLLGVPLQLFIITELFITNRKAYDELIEDNIFILTKMYQLFFEGKKKFQYERLGVDQQAHQLGFSFTQHLKQYEIPALKSCLDSMDFDNLGLDLNQNRDFINNIKRNGDKFGIIKTINKDEQIIFVHQTYAEYFACVWFESHLDKMRELTEKIFSERYQNLKLIFDIMMAEDRPLHLAVIYKNLTQFENHIVSDLGKKDKAGRSVLHLVCSTGMKYTKDTRSVFYVHLNREHPNYVTIVDVLLSKFHFVFDRDTLFNYHCVDYSLKSYCLYPIEKMLDSRKFRFDSIADKLYENFGAKNLAYHSAQLGYFSIFAAVIQKYPSFIDDESFGHYRLLGTAIIGSQNDQYLSPREGNIKIVDMLIKNGADVDIMSDFTDKCTLLEYVCDNGIYDMVQILIRNGGQCTNGNNILHRTALKGTLNQHIIKILRPLDFHLRAVNSDLETPLHVASKLDQPEIVKLLLDNGANVNMVAKDDNTALHFAAGGNTATVRLLCGRDGVNINAQNRDGRTALHIACGLGQIDNVNELLGQNVDNAIVDNDAMNALHHAAAAARPNTEIIRILKDRGFDINARDRLGKTPLHLACSSGHFENVRKLIDLGAGVNIDDGFDNSALHCAAQSERDNVETIRLLIGLDLDVNGSNRDGQTPLHMACQRNVLKNVEELVRMGADVNLADCNDKTAHSYACDHSNARIIWLIWDKMEETNRNYVRLSSTVSLF